MDELRNRCAKQASGATIHDPISLIVNHIHASIYDDLDAAVRWLDEAAEVRTLAGNLHEIGVTARALREFGGRSW